MGLRCGDLDRLCDRLLLGGDLRIGDRLIGDLLMGDRLIGDRDRLIGDRDLLIGDRDRLIGDRDRLIGDRDRLIGDLDRLIGDLLLMGDLLRYDGGECLGKRHLPCGDIRLRGDLPLRLPTGTLAGLGGRTSLQVTCCPSSHPPSMYLIASLASRPNLYST